MKKSIGTIVWSAILILLGSLFLLGNFFPNLRPWRLLATYWSTPWLLFARFWPVIIIVWGTSKLVSTLRSHEDPAAGRRSMLSSGDVVLLVFLCIAGLTASGLTKAFHGGSWRSHRERPGFAIEDWGFSDSRPAFEFIEEVSEPAGAKLARLEVTNRFGNVDLFVHDLPSIKVKLRKKVKADDESQGRQIADRLKVVMERDDDGFSLTTNRDSLLDEWRRGMETHLSVWVPKATAVTVSNEHGSVSIEGISGQHAVTNAHGSVTIKNVDGGLRVENQHGAVTVSGVTGDCEVENKHGAVAVESVGGQATVENAHGSVDLRKIKGPVELSNRYGSVTCEGLDAGLNVDAKYSDIHARNVAGDVQVSTAYRDIELQEVLGSINVRGQHGDISIRNSRPQEKPIAVDAQYSGIEIHLPKESRFELDASTKYGKFVSGFESLKLEESTEGKKLRVRGSTGGGGPSITISTTYRGISLNPS